VGALFFNPKYKSMSKTEKLSAGEKAAHISGKYSTRNKIIGGLFLIGVTFLTLQLSKSNKEGSKIQEVKQQNIDSGSINNYNAKGDINISNNYTNKIAEESLKNLDKNQKSISIPETKKEVHEQTNVTSINQSGGQTAKEIINNNN